MAGSSALFSVIWRLCVQPESRAEQSRAAPCRARISHYSPLPLLARQPSPLLAWDLIFGFGRPLFPALCHYATQIEKAAHRDGRGRRRGAKGDGRIEESVPSLDEFGVFAEDLQHQNSTTVKHISLPLA